MFGNAKENRIKQLRDQFYGKNFIWKTPISSEQVGDPTRCCGVREREDGELCLDLSHGMPVPLSRVNIHLEIVNEDAGAPPTMAESGIEEQITRDPSGSKPNFQKQSHADLLGNQNVRNSAPKKIGIFDNFNKRVSTFNVQTKIELPEKELVEMMYRNSMDKDGFINEFAEYVISNINIDSVKSSINKMLCPDTDDSDNDLTNGDSSIEEVK